MTNWPADLNATEYSIFVISRTLRLTYMPLFRRKAQPRQTHPPPRYDAHTQSLTRCQAPKPGCERWAESPSLRAMCSCTAVLQCTASTCSEVGLALRASWTTSWLAAPNGSLHTILMGRAHRLPRLRCRRSNSQLQRRTLSRSLWSGHNAALRANGLPQAIPFPSFQCPPNRSSPESRKTYKTRHGPISGAIS